MKYLTLCLLLMASCGKISTVSVPGSPGPAGPQGKAGTDGTNGKDGKDGAPGVTGANGANSIVSEIAPCGNNSSPYKEQLLCLSTGVVLASFSDSASGLNTRFANLGTGTYDDTDSSGCQFSVVVDTHGSTTVSWSAGSNQYSIWTAGTYTCQAGVL